MSDDMLNARDGKVVGEENISVFAASTGGGTECSGASEVVGGAEEAVTIFAAVPPGTPRVALTP